MKKQYLLFTFVMIIVNMYAQAPQNMSYQAVIRDSNNNLVTTSTVGMQVSILQGSATGSAIFVETHTTTTNANGLLTIEIGGGSTVVGTFSSINWENGPYFIKTETDPAGGTNYSITGTSQLLSVPYALYAQNSGDNMWKKNSSNSNIYYPTGKVTVGGSGDTTSTFNAINSSPNYTFNSNTNIASFQRIINGSSAHFLIYGYPDNSTFLPHLRKSAMLYATGDADNLILCAGKPTGTIRFITQNWSLASSEKMRITETGNIGIGTTTPTAKLHVSAGDVYVDDSTKGIILKSPNGNCYRITVDNTGTLIPVAITCP